MPQTFKSAFCECFNCPEDRYGYEALKRCLYPHAGKMWRFLDLAGGNAVLTANTFIQMAGQAQSKADLLDIINEYRDDLKPHSGYMATHWKIRVSVDRLVALHDEVRSELAKRKTASSSPPNP